MAIPEYEKFGNRYENFGKLLTTNILIIIGIIIFKFFLTYGKTNYRATYTTSPYGRINTEG
jgi:hypothetical protein